MRSGLPALGNGDLRGLVADLAMIPLLAVGEVLLVAASQLLHGADVGPAGGDTQKRRFTSFAERSRKKATRATRGRRAVCKALKSAPRPAGPDFGLAD